MKTILSSLLLLLSSSVAAEQASFEASLADPAWNGKTIPKGQQCNKFGGQGMTPRLSVRNIPTGSTAIVMEYSDLSYAPMSQGGHGKIGYRPGTNLNIEIPSIAGHSFDLPENFFLIAAQQAPQWDKAGAYLPPCSGGKGNQYQLTVKAIQQNGSQQKVLAETRIPLGLY